MSDGAAFLPPLILFITPTKPYLKRIPFTLFPWGYFFLKNSPIEKFPWNVETLKNFIEVDFNSPFPIKVWIKWATMSSKEEYIYKWWEFLWSTYIHDVCEYAHRTSVIKSTTIRHIGWILHRSHACDLCKRCCWLVRWRLLARSGRESNIPSSSSSSSGGGSGSSLLWHVHTIIFHTRDSPLPVLSVHSVHIQRFCEINFHAYY